MVERQRILFYPKSLYVRLRELMSYTFSRSEAWIIERSLNIVYRNIYECEDYVFDTELLIEKICNLPDLSDYDTPESTLSRIKTIFYSLSDIIKTRRS